MGIKVTRRIDIQARKKKLLDEVERRFEQSVSNEVTRMIVRFQRGQSVEGGGFDPYTPAYAKYRAKKGRRTTPVDLTFTGAMARAITYRVRRIGQRIRAEVFFSNAKDAAKAAGNLRYRKFFGFSSEQLRRIKQAIDQALR